MPQEQLTFDEASPNAIPHDHDRATAEDYPKLSREHYSYRTIRQKNSRQWRKGWGEDAKEKAERILNAALDASQKMMAKAAQEGGSSVAAVVNKEIEGSINMAVRTVRGLVTTNVTAAVITLVAQCISFIGKFSIY